MTMKSKIDFLNIIFSQKEVLATLMCAFFGTFAGFWYLVTFGQKGFSKRFFYVPARKSTTNAIQLGGFPLSMGVIASLVVFLLGSETLSILSVEERELIRYWMFSSSIIIFYGYLDDRYELRPIAKLFLQFFSVFSFALLQAQNLSSEWTTLAFVVLGIWGMGCVNGSNLLDGLDTLTIKLSSVSFIGLFAVGVNFGIPSVAILSVIGLLCLSAFYFFNKEPAKVHLGEIGGSFIGFTCLLISCLSFKAISSKGFSQFDALAISLLPLSLPMVELGLSFLRRIYNRKSPFRGDRLHVHHLLKNYYELKPSHVASIMGGAYLTMMIAAYVIQFYVGTWSSYLFLVSALILSSIAVGKKYWNSDDTLDLKPTSLFQYLRKKDVSVINSLEVDEFELKLVDPSEIEDDNREEHLQKVA